MLRVCLEKDRKLRLRDIGDAWKLLGPQVGTVRARSKRWISAGAFGIVLGAGIVWTLLRPGLTNLPQVVRW